VSVLALSVQSLAQQPSPDQVKQAITDGAKAKELSLAELRAGGGFATMGTHGPVIARYSTPIDRVRLAAFSAARSYQPFTAANVTNEMLAPDSIFMYPLTRWRARLPSQMS
jgi:hypothetical protein